MARKLRLQFPGAIYHVMSRGDRRDPIFRDDSDRESFLQTLAAACAKTGWLVHAFCLLPDHFHLLIETPQANLVPGMKWFLGTYTARFNRRHGINGHVFSGRYRSSMVGPSGGYLRQVADYIHLNPVRAQLLEPGASLESFRWSSYPAYLAGPSQTPGWLEIRRILVECHISPDQPNAGRQYEIQMKDRQQENLKEEFESIRRNWCFGDDLFRTELLTRVEGLSRTSHFGSELQEASEAKARRIIDEELRRAVWTRAELLARRKGDPQKLEIAQRLRIETTVTLNWIATQLHMGTKTHLSHLLYWNRRANAEGGESDTAGQRPTKPARVVSTDNSQARIPRAPADKKTKRTAQVRKDSMKALDPDPPANESTIPSTDPFEFDTRFD
jgi:putative transposase